MSTIRYERRREAAAPIETALVVAMQPLDPERVRLFATAKGAPNVDKFIAQIESANLWSFARRPLDLDWLVQFWQHHGCLGSLSEMLETSLRERVKESNLERARADSLDTRRALHGLERVGAALVFGRTGTIAIPDSELTLSRENAPLDLAKVLPDWSPEDRTWLMTRAVFDLATFGRVRLHNDNQAVVRAYLAARWLRRLRGRELSQLQLFDLLFAETYGIRLIKPSMRETAAWLAIWDEAVAAEVTEREPWVLLTAGDPASLPAILRQALLTRLVGQIISNDERLPPLDRDSLKRFSRPDIAATVRACWSEHKEHTEVRHLLLRLIALGELKDCADLAAEVAFGPYQDRRDRLFAGWALMATGDATMKARYSELIKANCATLPNTVVWDAIKGLFPAYLSIDDFLAILATIDVTDRDGGLGLDWEGSELIARLGSASEVEHLLTGLLSQLGGTAGKFGYPPDKREQAYFPVIAAAAYRLLEQAPDREAPTLAIDAALRLGEHRRTPGPSRKAVGDWGAQLRRTPERRRITFWRAAGRLTGHRMLQGRAIESPWEMEILGWPSSLTVEDLDWLVADGPTRSAENERRLAINAALQIWHGAGSSPAVLGRIEAVAREDAAMSQAYAAGTQPRQKSAEEIKSEQELEDVRHRGAVERAAIDQSWINFVAQLRADPEQLHQFRPTTADGADARLFSLWQLLRAAQDSSQRYAIDSVAPLEPMIGPELAAAVQKGLSDHWRAWQLTLKSAREPDKRNQIPTLDCMGIAGITLEANGDAQWAEHLSSDEARLAAAYATLEINGFPDWLSSLAAARPQEVAGILMGEIVAELEDPDSGLRRETLDDMTRAASRVQELIAPQLLAELERRANVPPIALEPMLNVIGTGLRDEPVRFRDLAISRFNAAMDANIAAQYIGAVFEVDAEAATNAFLAKLDTMSTDAQTALVQDLLPQVFGGHFSKGETHRRNLPFDSLERLVRLAFRTIRREDDRNRPAGVVFSPDARDNAERARSAAFNQLIETPGRATFDLLLRFAAIPGFPVSPSQLRELARQRAAADSESAPWPPNELLPFEQSCETAPSTARDLQLVALRRLSDMQHDLLNADFRQGTTLSALPDETDVQNWVADRLRLKQDRSYGVERESHVAEEKEPDVRLRAKKTDASVPIEIKVAESWTLEQLEAALTEQLCVRYLRAKDARHGVLLLVHKIPRPRGWKHTETGAFLSFNAVVTHLRALAAQIAGATSDAPQPEIAALDVSSCARENCSPTTEKGKSQIKSATDGKRGRGVSPAKTGAGSEH